MRRFEYIFWYFFHSSGRLPNTSTFYVPSSPFFRPTTHLETCPKKHKPLQWMSCFTLHQFVIEPKIHNVDFWINCFVFFVFILIITSFALKCHKKSQRVEARRSTVPANLKVIQSIIHPWCGLDAESLYMTLNLYI